jgi:hypothetical protein
MAQVEHAGTLANGMMLFGQTGVPDWHLEATKLDQSCTMTLMRRIQYRLLHRLSSLRGA